MGGGNEHTGRDRGSGSVNDGGVEVGLAEGGCHTSSYSQHLPEGVLISVSHLQQVREKLTKMER